MATVLDSTALSSQDKCPQAIEIKEDFRKMNSVHRAVVLTVINVSYHLLRLPVFLFVILINVVQAQDFSRFMG